MGRALLSQLSKASLCSICVLLLSTTNLHSQCPRNGQTKVIKPNQGTGYYFYKFLGDSSYRYFIDGKTFSFNDKDDPGRTFIFIDDVAYESILKNRDTFKKYIEGSKDEDILVAEAKQHQDHFKSLVPSIVITDFGVSSAKNDDGSEGRAFYLWKKENPPGKEAATQYLCSTVVKDGVVVLSIILNKPSVSEEVVFSQLREYTSHFITLSGEKCAQVLSWPSAP
jgi:hypothetical protein